eukprot:scaffold89458_cov48-Phaeocystis_antarctica.AAC.1
MEQEVVRVRLCEGEEVGLEFGFALGSGSGSGLGCAPVRGRAARRANPKTDAETNSHLCEGEQLGVLTLRLTRRLALTCARASSSAC